MFQVGTPLNLILGHIQVVNAEQGPGSSITRRLQIALEQIRKVTATVRGLLARSRRQIERETADLGALIRRMCTLVRPALEAAGAELTLDGEGIDRRTLYRMAERFGIDLKDESGRP